MNPARADVYKCVIHGQTVYRDVPCPGKLKAKPYMKTPTDRGLASERDGNTPVEGGQAAGDAAPDANREARLASLDRRFQAAKDNMKDLERGYQAARRAMVKQVASLPIDQRILKLEKLHAKWGAKKAAVFIKAEKAQRAMDRLCPRGVIYHAHVPACR
jgi:hypothetical protein